MKAWNIIISAVGSLSTIYVEVDAASSNRVDFAS